MGWLGKGEVTGGMLGVDLLAGGGFVTMGTSFQFSVDFAWERGGGGGPEGVGFLGGALNWLTGGP